MSPPSTVAVPGAQELDDRPRRRTSGVRSSARVVAVPDGRGATRLAELRSSFPVRLRRTGPDTVHAVATGAGPLGGDRLHLDVEVAKGARLRLASVGASVVLPGRDGARSCSEVTVHVGAGGSLDLQLGPTVLCAGVDHRARTAITLDGDAQLRWRDVVVLGRADEPPGRVRLRTDVVGPDGPLLREVLAVGPDDLLDPHRLGGARVLGMHLHAGGNPQAPPPAPSQGRGRPLGDVRCAVHRLVGGAMLTVALGGHAHEVAQALDTVSGPSR